MLNKELIIAILELGEATVKPLFKEKQFEILKKISFEESLNDTEKRYLRGHLGKKLFLLNLLNSSLYNPRIIDYFDFLKNIGEYYITGLEALKNNGYGWDFKTKIIEVLNLRLSGEVEFSGKILKFIKVRSIKRSKFVINKSNLLKYATNEQIIKDSKITKNLLVRKKWMNHYFNYGDDFSKFKPSELNNE